MTKQRLVVLLASLFLPGVSMAATGEAVGKPLEGLEATMWGFFALAAFIVAYIFVISEEFLHLRKSKPVLVAAGVIWFTIGIAYAVYGGDAEYVHHAVKHNILEVAELIFFLLAAMTYINTMDERQVFKALRAWLVSSGFTLRVIFWLTGLLAFFISPLADNLTTALLMGAVVMAVGGNNKAFVVVGCINVVVAANAGGAFSPFGDITTLMVWQKHKAEFFDFFWLAVPSFVNWFIPAFIMSWVIPKQPPQAVSEEVRVLYGGYVVIVLFLLTITMTVMGHNFLHLPPVVGMMTGLGVLKVYGFILRKQNIKNEYTGIEGPELLELDKDKLLEHYKPRRKPFDIFISMKRAEWDTLMFFYGVVLCVGGLGTLGYLALASQVMYVGLGPTWANVLVGILSAIVDNIPVMVAVLAMDPHMPLNQWLLVTLTAGVGGSMLSIGSAAGVALMGQARGVYTFFAHLKWTWAIILGYAASIWAHLLVVKFMGVP